VMACARGINEGDRQNEKDRRIGPLSRPLIRSGQRSQTTTGILQHVDRLSADTSRIFGRDCGKADRECGTFSKRAFNTNTSMVLIDDVFASR